LLIKEGPDMRDGLLSLLNRPNKKLWGAIIDDLDILLSRYVRALLLLSIATFVSYSIAFSLMGVPYGLLLARPPCWNSSRLPACWPPPSSPSSWPASAASSTCSG
jgi:hypothetical protein